MAELWQEKFTEITGEDPAVAGVTTPEEAAQHYVDSMPTNIVEKNFTDMPKREDTLMPSEASMRDVIAANEYTGRALEPLVNMGDTGVGLVDVAGGPLGAAVAGMDVHDVAVRDAGPFEKAATYVTAPLAVVPLIGKPTGKAARAAAKSIDNLFGMGKKSMSKMMEEAETASKVKSPAAEFVRTNAPDFQTPTEMQYNDFYDNVKASGFGSDAQLYALDPLDIGYTYGPEGMQDVRHLINDKANTLRYRNDDMRKSLVSMFEDAPENYAENLNALETVAGYLGDWAHKDISAGEAVLSPQQIINTFDSTETMAKVESKIAEARFFGAIDEHDARDFLENYKKIAEYDRPLYYMSQVATYNKMSQEYAQHINSASAKLKEGIDYGKMPDKEFFQSYAANHYNPYRKGPAQQPVLHKSQSSPELVEFTGEAEPLVFIHGTTSEFTQFIDAPKAEVVPTMIQRVQDTAGFHVGTPSQAGHFSVGAEGGRSLPVVLKKTRKINDALEEMGDELGFDAELDFLNNPNHMRNGVMTEEGIDFLASKFGTPAMYVSKKVGKEIKNYLMNKGVTYIPYINKSEDVGDVSVWVLDNAFAKHPRDFNISQP